MGRVGKGGRVIRESAIGACRSLWGVSTAIYTQLQNDAVAAGHKQVLRRLPRENLAWPAARSWTTVGLTLGSPSIEFIEFTEDLEDGTPVKGLLVREAASATARDLAAAIKQIRPQREEVVVVAADHAVATQVKQITRMLAQNRLLTERLVEAMFVPDTTVSPAGARQAQRNAQARQELIDEFGLRDSDQIADLAGSAASNRSATASRWLAAGKIFAVNHRGACLFPNFQFGTDGHPWPVIAKALEVFEPYGLDGWETALWFTTRSGWLDDERPVALLTREPEQVIGAARHAVDEVPA